MGLLPIFGVVRWKGFAGYVHSGRDLNSLSSSFPPRQRCAWGRKSGFRERIEGDRGRCRAMVMPAHSMRERPEMSANDDRFSVYGPNSFLTRHANT
jgi:hypothetical protein